MGLKIKCLPYTSEEIALETVECDEILHQTQKNWNIHQVHHAEIIGTDHLELFNYCGQPEGVVIHFSDVGKQPGSPSINHVSSDMYVAVAYDDSWFVGRVTNRKDNMLVITFMRRQSDGKFRWPQMEDIDEIDEATILGVLSSPTPTGTSRIIYTFDQEDLLKIETAWKNI